MKSHYFIVESEGCSLLSNTLRRERIFPSAAPAEIYSRGWRDSLKLIWGDWWLHKKSLACTAMDLIQIISVWKLHLEAWCSKLWLHKIKIFYKSYKTNLYSYRIIHGILSHGTVTFFFIGLYINAICRADFTAIKFFETVNITDVRFQNHAVL